MGPVSSCLINYEQFVIVGSWDRLHTMAHSRFVGICFERNGTHISKKIIS